MRPDALTQTGWERHQDTETVADSASANPTVCPLCKVPLKSSLEKH